MSKNIVLCSDGTGNSTIKDRGTNVFRLFEAIDLHGHKYNSAVRPQVAYYDDGVGAESMKFIKMLGGVFGWGVSRNVRELYTALAQSYDTGDSIFLFGFSRGAYTVRMLAGFIIGCGVIDKSKWHTDAELRKLVRKAFRKYRQNYQTWLGKHIRKLFFARSKTSSLDEFRSEYAAKHQTHAPEGKARIRFIGVWDTVDAVGLPFDQLADFLNLFIFRFKFPDHKLSQQVEKACHAISIDDERHSFHPDLWDEDGDDNNRIEQVWFAGVHANVGGGYPKQGMSLVSLDWMMAKAGQAGLRFLDDARAFCQGRQNINDKLYNSRSGAGVYYRYKVRDIAKMCLANHTSAKIHVSTFDRIAQGTDGYAPVNIPAKFQLVATDCETPAAKEDAESLKQLAEKVRKSLANEAPRLQPANKWMAIRRYSHYAFMIMTLALLGFVAGTTPEPAVEMSGFLAGILKACSFVVGDTVVNRILKPILTGPVAGLALLGLLVVFFSLGLLTRSKIEEIYSRFWRKTLPEQW